MFRIVDGDAAFTQWATNKKLTNEHMVAGDRVYFRAPSGATVIMYAYGADPCVDVPNALLQDDGFMVVELHGRPSCTTRFCINAADKPADYVCPEDNPHAPETGGGGMPTGEAPYQQLVTDADGKAVWEEKAFYEEVKSEEIIPLTTFDFAIEYNGMYMAQASIEKAVPEIDLTKPVTVVVDGETYNVNAVENDGHYTIGNSKMVGGEDTGEPFCFLAEVGKTDISMVSYVSGGEHTISVSAIVSVTKKIPRKFLDIIYTLSEGDEDDVASQQYAELLEMYIAGKVPTIAIDGEVVLYMEPGQTKDGVPRFEFLTVAGYPTVDTDYGPTIVWIFRTLTENGWRTPEIQRGSRPFPTAGYNDKFKNKYLRLNSDALWRYTSDIIVESSTEGSTKLFKITVDDNGTLGAVEYTEE